MRFYFFPLFELITSFLKESVFAGDRDKLSGTIEINGSLSYHQMVLVRKKCIPRFFMRNRVADRS